MKKYMLMGLLLLASFAIFAQAKTAAKSDYQKWKTRLRVIDAIPPATSYTVTPGTDVEIGSSIMPELDFTYFLTKNLAAELILGTTHHKVSLAAEAKNKTELGKVWLLPPTLNVQYHIPLKAVEPYFGAGINYTIFYGEKDAGASLEYKNKFGVSTQAGADFRLNDNWFINLDFKRIFLKTDVTMNSSAKLRDVKIDPWIIGIGIGTKF